MVPAAVLAMLACPVCHAALAPQPGEPAPAIRCTGCQRVYPIVDGIPVLLAERAQ